MFVSAYLHPKWLDSEGDRDLCFLKQVGISHVAVRLGLIGKYEETGTFERAELEAFVDRLGSAGIRIERVLAMGITKPVDPDQVPDLQEQIDKLCGVIEMVGAVGIPLLEPKSPSLTRAIVQASVLSPYFFQGMYAGVLIDPKMRGWEERQGRGGYTFPAFRLMPGHNIADSPAAAEAREKLWQDLFALYRVVLPVAERAGVSLAQHGADPPLPVFNGRAQVLYCDEDFDRLFREMPSARNRMTFCVGTRYESGRDLLSSIRHFGCQGKIAYVHFRNVRGTLLEDGGYEERMIDDGDIDMAEVVRTLHEVGYTGALDLDHVVRTNGDSFIGRQSLAFSAGYIRGLLAALD